MTQSKRFRSEVKNRIENFEKSKPDKRYELKNPQVADSCCCCQSKVTQQFSSQFDARECKHQNVSK